MERVSLRIGCQVEDFVIHDLRSTARVPVPRMSLNGGQGSEIQSPVALMAIFWAVIESQTSAVGRRSISPYSTTLKWSKVWLPLGADSVVVWSAVGNP